MLIRKDKYRFTIVVVFLALSINSVLIYFVFHQFFGIQQIDKVWRGSAVSSIRSASLLAEVESNMGYLGFIHNFKNYIIRGSEDYYDKALVNYEKTSSTLSELRASDALKSDINLIDNIQTVLNRYHEKLLLAKTQPTMMSVTALDELVRVNDDKAREALELLREKLLPRLAEETSVTDDLVVAQKDNALSAVFVILPLVAFFSLFAISLINSLFRLTSEYSTIFDISPDGILFVDSSGKVLRSNRVANEMFGYSASEFKNLSIEDLMHESHRQKHKAYRDEFSVQEGSRRMRSLGSAIKGKTKDGRSIDLSIAISARRIDGVMHSVCILRDDAEHNELKDQAEHDHLTALYNRRTIEDIVNREIDRSVRLNKEFSVLLMDIDNFKSINDTLGHPVGDEAIKAVSAFLQQQIRTYDSFGRWGGDEFLMLCPELNESESTSFAERMRQGVESLPDISGHKITLSIGVTTRTKDRDLSYDDLLKDADSALYKAKQNGRNQVVHASQIQAFRAQNVAN